MPLFFDYVGRNMSKSDQEDYKDTQDSVWNLCQCIESEHALDIKDAYLFPEEESMTSQQLKISKF